HLRVQQRCALFVAGLGVEVEAELVTGGDGHLAAGEIAEPQFRPLHVGEDADWPPGLGLDATDVAEQCAVVIMRAVAEIAAEHIDTRVEPRAQPRRARTRLTEGGDDLGAALPLHRSFFAASPLS